MADIKLNLVTDFDLLINKGDAMECLNETLGYNQLIIVCPGCGKLSGSKGTHRFYQETNSYTPSIVHNKDLGGCGWHGWLTNGVFKSC